MTLTDRAGFRYLRRHPWLTALSILGIALGVAVVVAIDVANSSAQRSFELSAEHVTGRATHSITAAEHVDGDVFRRLRVEAGVRPSAPIVEGYASIRGRTFEVVGVDPFFDRPFRGFAASIQQVDLGAFLAGSDVVLIAESAAAELGIAAGDTVTADVAGRTVEVIAGGLLEGDAVSNLIVTDIGTAQALFDMGGSLSRIDLILPEDAAAVERIASLLPDGVRIAPAGTRTDTMRQMTHAFEVNLTALSLLALIVGMFLIYNTMTFAVVQRRPLIGRMRAIGVTRGEVFRLILVEACVLGVVGTAVGIAGGIALSTGLVKQVTQTINDLYYVVDVRSISIDPWIVVKGAALGMGATILAALAPAREAASAPVSTVLQRSEDEVRLVRALPRLTLAAAVIGVCAVGVIAISGRSLALSYGGLLLILIAFALATPAALKFFALALRPVMGRLFGVLGRMAAQGVIHNLSRTGVAAAALAIAVAAAVGVGIMIGSFRTTVVSWLEYTLQADLYIQAPSPVVRQATAPLDERLLDVFAGIDGVESAASIRRIDVVIDGHPVQVSGIMAPPERRASFHFVRGDPDEIWRQFEDGALVVSEPFVFRTGIGQGDTLSLPTDVGEQRVPVAGVFYDYASDLGVALMGREAFTRYFDVEGFLGISLYLADGASLERVADAVRAAAGDRRLVVRSNRDLRRLTLEVFDRSFAITAVLRLLALVVAFVGVISALMALQIEREREFAVLRAEGLTPGQLWRYITMQTGVMGLAAGLLAVPLGMVLAVVLVFVINKRSFGWTLELAIDPALLLQAVAIAVVASIVAGIYPSWKLSRANPADALRGE